MRRLIDGGQANLSSTLGEIPDAMGVDLRKIARLDSRAPPPCPRDRSLPQGGARRSPGRGPLQLRHRIGLDRGALEGAKVAADDVEEREGRVAPSEGG